VTLRQTINYGKKYAYFSSIGIGFGIFFHLSYTFFGIGLILNQFPRVFEIIQYLGAFYLIYLGIENLKSSSSFIKIKKDSIKDSTLKLSFITGFLTNVLNPKATLFFLSIFTSIVSIDTPFIVKSSYGLFCIFANIFWYSMIAFIFSKKRCLNLFDEYYSLIDKFLGIILIALGFIIIFK